MNIDSTAILTSTTIILTAISAFSEAKKKFYEKRISTLESTVQLLTAQLNIYRDELKNLNEMRISAHKQVDELLKENKELECKISILEIKIQELEKNQQKP